MPTPTSLQEKISTLSPADPRPMLMEEMDTLLVAVEDSTDEDVVDSNKADPEARVDVAISDRIVDVEEHLEAVAPANPPTHDLPLN